MTCFIGREQDDYIRREAMALGGLQQRRSLLVILDEVLYEPYFVNVFVSEAHWKPKAWEGAAVLVVHRKQVVIRLIKHTVPVILKLGNPACPMDVGQVFV